MSTREVLTACVSVSRSRELALPQGPVAHILSIASIPSISSTPSASGPKPNHFHSEPNHFHPEPNHFHPEPIHFHPKSPHFHPKFPHSPSFCHTFKALRERARKFYFSLWGPRPAEPETLLARKTPRNNRYKSERKCNEDGINRKESGKKVERNRKESGKKMPFFKDLAEWGMRVRTHWPAVQADHLPLATGLRQLCYLSGPISEPCPFYVIRFLEVPSHFGFRASSFHLVLLTALLITAGSGGSSVFGGGAAWACSSFCCTACCSRRVAASTAAETPAPVCA